ncbi:hypothetical protein H2198_000810 [Neophaeococcomyces mojaviensis]|uniref:Uncharacterized protein n=1 Tax=Neophaeococcomyces mojaviensis TaxID=3383035 RepID=A0ACC3AJ78_9EURO|nr:hypothetical protein H2198_000810 [Knufia sp. JES_112]
MSNKTYNVGVVGYGLSAKIFHIPFINDARSFRLHAIVQRSPKPSDDAAKDHPEVKVYHSTEDLVADSDVDVVVLTTTPATHHELAIQAMKHGKHVLVEKPFTPTSEQARDLAKAAKEQKVLLTVYQNRRYDSDFLTLKSLLDANKLGRVVEFETHFDRHRPEMPAGESWKTKPEDYSAVFDLGTHLMDQVVSLYGLPERITGFVGTQRGSRNTTGLEDSFTAIMHYPDNLIATAKAAVVSPEAQQLRYWVRGEKGSFKKFHLDPQEDQLKTGLRPGQQGYGVENESKFGTLATVGDDGKIVEERIPTVSTNGYTAFYDQFAKALDAKDEKLLPVVPTVAADVIRLVELVRQSSQEGRTLTV